MFVVVYCIVFSAGIYYINRLIVRGPRAELRGGPPDGLPNRPLGGAGGRAREALAEPAYDGLETLPVIWALLIGTAVALYVILDGFDLGIGILFPFFREEEDRDQMMNSVAPFWDGNETWLVLGGGGLWVAFPQAYAIIMPAVYLPVIIMLLALVFRGVAFEFRWVAKPRHGWWDVAFAAGSTVAAFSQG
jgi:hypothetical protein